MVEKFVKEKSKRSAIMSNYKGEIRDIYLSQADSFRAAITAAEEHRLRYQVFSQVMLKMRFHGGLKKRLIMYELAKVIGITSHTLYVSISACKAISQNTKPSKYAQQAYNEISRSI